MPERLIFRAFSKLLGKQGRGDIVMAKFGFSNVMNALAGNILEAPLEKLGSEYSGYLFDDEQITMGYKLVRDVIIFTSYRIIFVDKQGATGKKTSFKSIYLFNIIDVEMETAGVGFDDSEINESL